MSTPPLTIQLFGPLRVLVQGEPMPRVPTRAVEWLLALLVLRHGRTVDRAWLAGTLWPDSEESRALSNLRDMLVHLRKALGLERARVLSPTRDTLTLDLEGVEVDVVRFDRAVRNREEAEFKHAVEVYTGTLLEGCTEEWVFSERASREQACLRALETLADAAEQRQDYAEALVLFRRAESMDALSDSTQRGLMRMLTATRHTPAALYAYREYRLRLREEMNVEPDEQTVQLYQQIREQTRQAAQKRDSTRAEAPPAPVSSPQTPSPPSTLPHPLTALIGREQETREISEALSRSRLVTLVGGGGVGKTRLSIQVARSLASDHAQEVVFVELAALSEPQLLSTFVVTVLGIREEASPQPDYLLRALTARLSTQPVLLVLDNCEHMIEAAASLTQTLLERCPVLRILTTSRQRLGLTGEVVWRVPSLLVPDLEPLPAEPAEAITAALVFPAIQLFVERAVSAHSTFQLTRREEVEAVCRICRRLDGIPLAIELAAARVRSLTVEDINGKLDQRFRLLTGGSPTALPRQQTLRSLIDWSYNLLGEEERALLCRLSVFSGGWTLEAAETICTGDLVEEWEMLDLLTSLVDKSLVVAETTGASVRYRLLETVRQYARDRLLDGGTAPIWRNRHLAFFLKLAEELEANTGSASQQELISHLEEEHDNLRAALDWSLKEKEGSASLRLCGGLQSFWRMRGHYTEGREWCSRVLGAVEAQVRTLERAKALNTAGILANLQGDYVSARVYHEESLDLFRELGDKRGIAGSLHGLGNVTSNQGDYTSARNHYEESLTLKRELGDRSGIGAALHNLGNVAKNQGDYASARAYYEESLGLFREIGHRQFLCNALTNLGRVAALSGDNSRASTYFEESLSIYKASRDRHGIATSMIHLGNLAHSQSDSARAQTYYEESLILYREMADRSGIGSALNNLGGVAYQREDYERARAYYEESLTIFRDIGYRQFLSISLLGLGNVAAGLNDYVLARPYYEEGLNIQKELGDRHGIATSLEAYAHMAVKNSKPELALLFWGAAAVLREEIGSPLPPGDEERYTCAMAEICQSLGEEAFAAAWARGRSMTTEQAIKYAISEG